MLIRNLLFFIFFVCSFAFKKEEQKEYNVSPVPYIYGTWKCWSTVFLNRKAWTKSQVASLDKSILHIEEDKIYFEGIDFMDPYVFDKESLKLKKIVYDEDDPTPLVCPYAKRPLCLRYTRAQLNKYVIIELGNPKECPYELYLNQDDLVLHYREAGALRFSKVPKIGESYKGSGKSKKTINLSSIKKPEYVRLELNCAALPTEVVVRNEKGKELYRCSATKVNWIDKVRVGLRGVKEVSIEVLTPEPNTEWKLEASVY
jgi:hypothetical protein